MGPLLYFTLISFVFVLTLKLIFQSTWLKNIPPGPPHFPIIGNIHLLKQPLHRTLQSLSQKYGSIMSLRFGSQLVVVISSQSTAQECFTQNDIILANRPQFLIGKQFYNNTTVTNSIYGDHWRNLRRIIQLEILSSHRLNTFYEIRRDEIMRLVQNLAKEYHYLSCNNNDQNGNFMFTKVELKSKFTDMTLNTIMRMMSGKRYLGEDCDAGDEQEVRRFRAVVKELQGLGGVNNPRDFVSILRWFDFDRMDKKVEIWVKKVDAFLQGIVDKHRCGGHRGNSMIDHLLIQQQSQPEYYTDEIIKGLILVMLQAGTDTTAITLEWAMSNLLDHPEILKKAKYELDTHIGEDRLVNEHDIPKLPYLEGIMNETLRLHPAAPLLLPHMSSQDCNIGGYHVPRDTLLLVNAWAIHRDPELWTEPTGFKPERFLKEGEANKLLSFGLGRRACPGANLAQRTVSLTLGLLIQCFEWKRTTQEEVDKTEEKGVTVNKKTSLEGMYKLHQPMTRLLLPSESE